MSECSSTQTIIYMTYHFFHRDIDQYGSNCGGRGKLLGIIIIIYFFCTTPFIQEMRLKVLYNKEIICNKCFT